MLSWVLLILCMLSSIACSMANITCISHIFFSSYDQTTCIYHACTPCIKLAKWGKYYLCPFLLSPLSPKAISTNSFQLSFSFQNDTKSHHNIIQNASHNHMLFHSHFSQIGVTNFMAWTDLSTLSTIIYKTHSHSLNLRWTHWKEGNRYGSLPSHTIFSPFEASSWAFILLILIHHLP